MSEKIVMILTDGFEEVEALGTVDFLRRLDFNVVLAGIQNDAELKECEKIKGAHGIVVEADIDLTKLAEMPDCVILPGGMPGSTNLRDNILVLDTVRTAFQAGKLVAAICAAPIVLNASGILKDKKITAHPSVKDVFKENTVYTGERIQIDNNIITAKAAGVTFEFAAKIAEFLGKEEEAEELLHAMYIVHG